jgi:hypothetical protein
MLNKAGTRVEFCTKGSRKNLAVLSGVGAVPRQGEFVNIRGETWRVVRVTWAVDQADKIGETELRANVELAKASSENS